LLELSKKSHAQNPEHGIINISDISGCLSFFPHRITASDETFGPNPSYSESHYK